MSDRKRWDEKHGAAEGIPSPSPLVVFSLPRLPVGRALDLACGRGANALYLASHGFTVDALDWSITALQRLQWTARARSLPVRAVACDVTRYPLPRARYSAVVCTRFLERAIWGGMVEALVPGGALLVETFTLRHLDRNPDFPRRFCLEPGELRRVFATSLRIARYVELPDEATASLLAFRDDDGYDAK